MSSGYRIDNATPSRLLLWINTGVEEKFLGKSHNGIGPDPKN